MTHHQQGDPPLQAHATQAPARPMRADPGVPGGTMPGMGENPWWHPRAGDAGWDQLPEAIELSPE
jgi:hypothetical protein